MEESILSSILLWSNAGRAPFSLSGISGSGTVLKTDDEIS
jgi:hypothetical protein